MAEFQIKDPTKRAWFELAMAHGKKFNSFIEIVPGTAQWDAWLAYFGRLGWMPHVLQAAIAWNKQEKSKGTQKTFTAPCEWPNSLGRA